MNAVAKIEQKALAPVSSEPALMSMIERMASDPNVDIDKFERFVAMRDRELARQAEQAFNEAMNAAQAEIGRVGADKTNGQTHSDYATYGALDREVRPVYSRQGFSLSFDTMNSDVPDHIRIVCYVSHSAGHTRTYRVDMPADGKGAKGGDVMTKTHAAGSAMTYGQRYLLKLIFNIAIGIDPTDDDGNAASGGEVIDPAWFDKAQGFSNSTEQAALKAEMIKRWGAATKIPKALMSAYNERVKSLRSAGHE
jgi:hypothetical protein